MVLDGQQGGLLPKWSQESSENFVMTGDPGPIIVTSLWMFGARNFDTAAALNLMESSSNGGTTQGDAIRGRQQELLDHHYLPNESSDSLEYSASDFAVAQFAKAALNDTAKFNTHMQRAQWWRNVFSDQTSFVTARNADGSFVLPLDPASEDMFTEGNAAQYTWMVTYNFQGLINLMGGRATAVQRLDHHFAQLNGGLTMPFFYIGNEPEHGVPWAYNFAGKPAGTSAAVRRVMTESFTSGPGGLPGNDDLGATSAWYVWAALGMYPATPGADTLALHGPLFPSVLVQRPGGNVQINASGSGQFVQSFALNGSDRTQNFIRFPDISGAATLNFTMGTSANSSWGTGANDVPPSFNDGFTPPSPAPDFGPDLAQGRAVTASAPCAAGEDAPMAVDGKLVNNSKWCSLAAGTKTLTVDLGSAQTVNTFVVKHAGEGAENTGWNTGAYTIQTSTDGANFATAVNVGSNISSRTVHSVSSRSARFVRLSITNPANLPAGSPGADAARVYELEVYNSGGVNPPPPPPPGPPPPPPPPGNLALNKPATGSTPCNANEGPEKAFNGSVSGGTSDKWCSLAATKFLQVDLGSSTAIGSFTVRHAGAGGESTSFDTRDFDILVSADGTNFSPAVHVTGNTANVTTHPVSANGRFVRLNVVTPTQTTDTAARIYELEVFAPTGGGGTNVALNRPATGSTPCNANEGPEKAVNGSVSGGTSDKWCSLVAGTKALTVDLGSVMSLTSCTVRHAGAGGESTSFNTRDFDILVSSDGTNFSPVVQVTGNTASVTTHPVSTTGRFVRLEVVNGEQAGGGAARIYELEVFA